MVWGIVASNATIDGGVFGTEPGTPFLMRKNSLVKLFLWVWLASREIDERCAVIGFGFDQRVDVGLACLTLYVQSASTPSEFWYAH